MCQLMKMAVMDSQVTVIKTDMNTCDDNCISGIAAVYQL
jgi:hypothetical protein